MDQSTAESLSTFSPGQRTLIPVVDKVSGSPKPYIPSATKIGIIKYVKRQFDFHGCRVVSEEEEDLIPVSTTSGSASDPAASLEIGEAWVDPEAVDHAGNITYCLKPHGSKSCYYSFYSAGPDSDLPLLQLQESANNCENSFNFLSKMYCEDEKQRLSLPYELRALIYSYAFTVNPTPPMQDSEPQINTSLLKTLPLVCRFLYVDVTTFINRDYFQHYFDNPLGLQVHLNKLNCLNSPFTKPQLALTRLRCIIIDLSPKPIRSPGSDTSTFVPAQCLRGPLTSVRTLTDNQGIRSARPIHDLDGREPVDWIPALTALLENFVVGKLVIRIGRGNVARWRRLPRQLRELVPEVNAWKVLEWQATRDVGVGRVEASGVAW